ncbi:MAG: aminotransferase class V-fold PLP-dependent enzyme [Pirellulaceae bacterium]|nr:aminotransferase class V-fold PLP-dependent enzyme [Pirellulaceae bacterium]
MVLDVDFARSQFPVFQRPETAAWAFFENAGGSYVPEPVIDRLDAFFRWYKVQPYGPFESSIIAGEAMDAGYQFVAQWLNANDDEVTVGPSTTLNGYVLAQALRPQLRPGDEIVITNQDHEANIGCWERLSEAGAVIRRWEIDPATGELALADLERLVNSRTRLVCFSLCSNIVGTFQDAVGVAEIAHRVGAAVVADGVSYAPHRLADVSQLAADVYLYSTYKTFGTHLGVMWIRRELQERIVCQGHYFNRDKARYRMNPTGPLHAEIAALAGIGEYFDRLYAHHFTQQETNPRQRAERVFGLVAEHETRLAEQLLQALRALPGIRIIGQTHAREGRRAATISFVSARQRSAALARSLALRKICVRNGHFYARRCVEALGIGDPDDGVLRVSMVHYNTQDEVQRLIDELQACCK